MDKFKLFEKHATHFSEQIKQNADHLDEVTIAGEIKSIVVPTSLEENSMSSQYIFKIDDSVGEIYVYLSSLMVNHYDFLYIGRFVSLTGFVNVIRRELKETLVRECSLVAYDAKELVIEESMNA